jgi:hypothetical protein
MMRGESLTLSKQFSQGYECTDSLWDLQRVVVNISMHIFLGLKNVATMVSGRQD